MSIAARRAELAQAITQNLAGLGAKDVKVKPYKANSASAFTGWLEINQTDTEATTLGELRISVDCLILIASDRTDFEKVHDVLTVPLMEAVIEAGGRAVVVQPAEYPIGGNTYYCLSAQFVTEVLI